MVINTVGHLAEAAWHHPDITASYAWVEVRLTNHVAKGVTDKDFELAKKIEDVIENFEPRAKLVGVRALPNLDRNEYEVTVEFYVVNTPTELVDLTIFLEVLR